MMKLSQLVRESFNLSEYEDVVEFFRTQISSKSAYYDSTVDDIRDMLKGKRGPIIRSDLRLATRFSGRRQYLYEFVEELVNKGIVKLMKIGRLEYVVPFNYDEVRGKKLSAIETYTNRDHVEMDDPGASVTFNSSISNGILTVVMRFDALVYPVAKLGSDGLYTKMSISKDKLFNAVEDGILNDVQMSNYLEKLEKKYDLKFTLSEKRFGTTGPKIENVVYSETAKSTTVDSDLKTVLTSIVSTGKPEFSYGGVRTHTWDKEDESCVLEDHTGQIRNPYKYAFSYCIPELVYTTNGDPRDS